MLIETFIDGREATPPLGWESVILPGDESAAVWRFDNPLQHSIPLPFVPPFAIFDAAYLPVDAGRAEVAFERRSFFQLIEETDYYLLMFDHSFVPGNGARATLQVFDGANWHDAATWTEETVHPQAEIIDISNFVGATTARVRFVFSGEAGEDEQAYWAIDNVRVYAAWPIDAGLVQVSSPEIPFSSGNHQLSVVLGNYGYNPLASTNIYWSLNSGPEQALPWNVPGDPLQFGETAEVNLTPELSITNPVLLKVWLSLPGDENADNDTLVVALRPRMQGDYFIGGANPDFASFGEAVQALSQSGVAGPVVFHVREGNYDERIVLGPVDGASNQNTITFRSDNANTENPRLASTIFQQIAFNIKGVSYLRFEEISFSGYDAVVLEDHASDIIFDNCRFTAVSNALLIRGGANTVQVENSRFQDADYLLVAGEQSSEAVHQIHIHNNHFVNAQVRAIRIRSASDMYIGFNTIENVKSGMLITSSDNVTIRNNRIHIVAAFGFENSGIHLNIVSNSHVYNNFISSRGIAMAAGMQVQSSSNTGIYYNSVLIANTDVTSDSRALWIGSGNLGNNLQNNIFCVSERGYPVYLEGSLTGQQMNHNNYYNPSGLIGRVTGANQQGLAAWRAATGYDAQSLEVNPFFSELTEPVISQSKLSGAANSGIPLTVNEDIDGSPRNGPTIGAWEYDACGHDAGINGFVSPGFVASPGGDDIVVTLYNHGDEVLASVMIYWDITGDSFSDSGDTLLVGINLPSRESINVALRDGYPFPPGGVVLEAWTKEPNGEDDCHPDNDASQIRVSALLCGEYTIGAGGDFTDFTAAMAVLNAAGISCPVVFTVRDGIYNEQIVIGDIQGSDASTSITFRSLNGTTACRIQFLEWQQSPVRIRGAQNINFQNIRFDGHYALLLEDNARNLHFEGCHFRAGGFKSENITNQQGVMMTNGVRDVYFNNNYFEGGYYAINTPSGQGARVRNVYITNNTFQATFHDALFINPAEQVLIDGNRFENIRLGILSGSSRDLTISNNWFYIDAEPGHNNRGIYVTGGTTVSIYNNFIVSKGNGSTTGIAVENSTGCEVSFNSIHIANDNVQGDNIGLRVNTSSGSGYQVRNNIFMVKNNGFPVYLEGAGQGLILDYNNYFSLDGVTGYYGTSVSGLDQWRVAAGQDMHSLSVNPYFSAGDAFFFPDEGPQINQVMLKDAGVPIDGITADIAGQPRGVTPDIGAWEFVQEDVDAGINGFTSPGNLVTGPQQIVVILQNHGNDALHSVTIDWEVDGQSQGSITWPGDGSSLASGASVEVELGTFVFEGGFFTIAAWTSMPNGTTDQNPANDRSELQVVGGLCGDHFIIGPGGDFINFSQAVAALNNAGITCDVTFTVLDGTYSEQLIIGDFFRAADNLTVTFIAENPDGDAVEVIAPGATFFSLRLDGANHIHFEGIGFRGPDAVVIDKTSSHISFDGCHFTSINNFGVDIKEACNHISFENGVFNGGVHSIRLKGLLLEPIDEVLIVNNRFNNPTNQAIHADKVNNMTIRDNRFEKVRSGILAFECRSLLIRENWILVEAASGVLNRGVEIDRCEDIRLYNNFFSGVGNLSIWGLYLKNNTQTELYFNTFNIVSDHQLSRAVLIEGGANLFIYYNNIYIQIGYPLYIQQLPNNMVLRSNNYFNQSGAIAYHNQSYNLPNWMAYANDNGSISYNPNFSSFDSPVHLQWRLRNQAERIEDIRYDIFGVRRHPDTPDIGCYESFIDFGITEVILPEIDCHTSSIDSISLSLIHSGFKLGDIDSLRVAMQHNGGSIQYLKVELTEEDEIFVTVPYNMDLTNPGTYIFTAWLPDVVDLGDEYPGNDLYSVSRVKYPVPGVDTDFTYACDRVNFFSDIDADPNDNVVSAKWLFGDGQESIESDPVHMYQFPGTYEVMYQVITASGCLVEDVFEVMAGETDAEVLIDEQVMHACGGEANGSIVLGVSGANAPYVVSVNGGDWSPATFDRFSFEDLLPGSYAFEIVDTLNCSASKAIEVLDVPLANPLIIAPDTVYIPIAVPFSFSADHFNYGMVEWSFNGQTSQLPDAEFTLDSIGTYEVSLTVYAGAENQCVEQVVHTIVAVLMPLDMEVEIHQQYCQADDLPSVILHIGGGVPPYRIYVDAVMTETITDTTWVFTNPIPGQSYELLVVDAYDQAQSATVAIVRPLAINPVIILTDAEGGVYLDEYTELLPFTVDFSFSYDDAPTNWTWRLGTQTSTASTASFSFDLPGEYLVELETYSGEPGNCMESAATFRVIVQLRVEIATIDVITPNGDGINDYFEVIHKGLVSLEVDIYDRRGRHVFHFNDLEGRWDGNYLNEEPAPDGMYPFFLRAMGYDEVWYERTGMIQLIRDAILVFPNPANSVVNIDPKGNIQGTVNIDIVDLRGFNAMSFRNLEFQDLIGLNISGLNEGLYVIRISDQTKVFHAKLQVVRQ